MADALTIGSNATGLYIAEEDTPGVLPGTPDWYEQEPNSYGDFGGEITTVARRPINPSRQRSKGVTTDLDAGGEFEADFTQDGVQRVMQGFLYADLRDKDDTAVATVDGTGNDYEPASGGTEFEARDLIFAKGFEESVNNGLKQVTGATTATSVPVTDTGLIAETGASGIISRVGYEFANDLASINVAGSLPKLVSANVAATGTLDATASAIGDGDTVTLGGVVYTFETGAINVAYEVLVGASDSDSLDNLIAAINAAAGAGTTYGTGTVQNPYVSAAAGAGDTVTLTARTTGQSGNLIATTTTIAAATLAATLSGGAGRDLTTLGIIPGETIFIGGDAADNQFDDSSGVNNGFKRVRAVTADEITFDKSDGTMVAETTADSRNIQIFFGRCLKNESDQTLQVARTYQCERQLGAADLAQPTQIQAEYLVNQSPDELEIDAQSADKLLVNYTFTGGTTEYRDGATGIKSGNRHAVVESPLFNTATDVRRIKLALIEDGAEAPTPLLASIETLTVSIVNNHSYNKKLGYLGSFGSNPGLFEVDVQGTGYFVDVAAQDAIRNNSDVTLEMQFVKENAGVSMDMPLGALGDGSLEVEADEAVRIPFDFMAARGRAVHADLDHTFFFVWFDYLPTLAETAA
jgi:hypothetical protein